MAKKRGQGEGNIRQRTDGTWEARYTVGVDENGKQKRKSIYGKTRKEVAEKLAKVINEINTGIYIEPCKITIKQWMYDWLENYKKHEVKPKTLEGYYNNIRLHIEPELGSIHLKDLRPEQIQSLYKKMQDKGLSPRMVELVHVTLHAALKQAMLNDLIHKNPTEATTRPKKQQKEKQIWDLKQQQQFMKSIKGHELEAAFTLGASLGLRIGEVCGLKWEDINFNAGTIQIRRTLQRVKDINAKDGERKTNLIFTEPKTEKSRRSLPISNELLHILKSHQKRQKAAKFKVGELWQENDLIFCTGIGTPFDPRKLTDSFY